MSSKASRSPHGARRWALAAAAAIAAGGFVLTMAGCQGSRWEKGLSTGPESAAPLAETVSVRFREVQWERVESTLEALRRDEAESSVNPSEWGPERRAEHRAKLLTGLQISEPAPRVRVLAKSEFRTTDAINVPSEEMEALARRLGADTVVWSRRLLGKADRVVSEPSTSFTDGTYWSRGADGRVRSRSYSETRTDWIPVRVQVDETAYIGFFFATR